MTVAGSKRHSSSLADQDVIRSLGTHTCDRIGKAKSRRKFHADQAFLRAVNKSLRKESNIQCGTLVLLGKGRWGTVYSAEVELVGRVAVKVCYNTRVCINLPRFTTIAHFPGQKQSEPFIHSNLHHANIVEFHDYRVDDALTYMVLELCESGTLHNLLEFWGHLAEYQVCIFAIQMLGAVKYLDSKNVVHRDLKPRNIFLDANMDIKIGDFGLAAILEPGERLFDECGTLEYMAPEVLDIQAEGYGGSADVWSVGVIM